MQLSSLFAASCSRPSDKLFTLLSLRTPDLNNCEAKNELKTDISGKLLPFCHELTYLNIKLERTLNLRHHLEALCKNCLGRHTAKMTGRFGMGGLVLKHSP